VIAVLRIVGLVVVTALAICVIAWLLTGNPRWRSIAWRVFKVSVFVMLGLLILFAAEALLGPHLGL
jgi:hypothetical protein